MLFLVYTVPQTAPHCTQSINKIPPQQVSSNSKSYRETCTALQVILRRESKENRPEPSAEWSKANREANTTARNVIQRS
jgi:hypothetical protein